MKKAKKSGRKPTVFANDTRVEIRVLLNSGGSVYKTYGNQMLAEAGASMAIQAGIRIETGEGVRHISPNSIKEVLVPRGGTR